MGGEMQARWAPDPSGRHQHRFWNGTAWTEHVADDGSRDVDPFPMAGPPRPAGPAPSFWPVPGQTRGPARMPPGTLPSRHPLATRPHPSAPGPAGEDGQPGAADPSGRGMRTLVLRSAAGTSIFAEPIPLRGPNRMPSHRQRPSICRQVAAIAAAAVLVSLVVVSLVAVVNGHGRERSISLDTTPDLAASAPPSAALPAGSGSKPGSPPANPAAADAAARAVGAVAPVAAATSSRRVVAVAVQDDDATADDEPDDPAAVPTADGVAAAATAAPTDTEPAEPGTVAASAPAGSGSASSEVDGESRTCPSAADPDAFGVPDDSDWYLDGESGGGDC